jgi:hypothetical protein
MHRQNTRSDKCDIHSFLTNSGVRPINGSLFRLLFANMSKLHGFQRNAQHLDTEIEKFVKKTDILSTVKPFLHARIEKHSTSRMSRVVTNYGQLLSVVRI